MKRCEIRGEQGFKSRIPAFGLHPGYRPRTGQTPDRRRVEPEAIPTVSDFVSEHLKARGRAPRNATVGENHRFWRPS